MSARTTVFVAGLIMLALGLAGLFYPDRVMGLLGFAALNTSRAAAVLGEVRATYGGLFLVMGVYTLLAGLDPVRHRARIMFVGFLWLGACAGRLVGAYLDGNPGAPGWAALAFELVMGGALVLASMRPTAPAQTPLRPSPAEMPQTAPIHPPGTASGDR